MPQQMWSTMPLLWGVAWGDWQLPPSWQQREPSSEAGHEEVELRLMLSNEEVYSGHGGSRMCTWAATAAHDTLHGHKGYKGKKASVKTLTASLYLIPGGSAGHFKREGYTFDVGSSMMFGFGDKVCVASCAGPVPQAVAAALMCLRSWWLIGIIQFGIIRKNAAGSSDPLDSLQCGCCCTGTCTWHAYKNLNQTENEHRSQIPGERLELSVFVACDAILVSVARFVVGYHQPAVAGCIHIFTPILLQGTTNLQLLATFSITPAFVQGTTNLLTRCLAALDKKIETVPDPTQA
eukprot:1157553-Pelagomonas_calceolata.AAC.5